MKDLNRLRLGAEERAPKTGGARALVLTAAGVVCLAGAAALALVRLPGEQTQEKATASAASPVAAPAPATPGGAAISAGGYVEALRTASLRPVRPGVVRAVHARIGERVEKGALLCELESAALQANVALAKADIDAISARLRLLEAGSRPEEIAAARADVQATQAQRDDARSEVTRLARLGGIISEGQREKAKNQARVATARVQSAEAQLLRLERGSRQAELEAARAEVQKAEARLARANADLEDTRVYAPFAGVVVRVGVQPGEAVGIEAPNAILLADTSELRVRVDVPETRIALVRLGARAEVALDALGSARLRATVVEIAPLANRQSNTVEVAVRLEEAPAVLRPDMSARVTILQGEPLEGEKR